MQRGEGKFCGRLEISAAWRQIYTEDLWGYQKHYMTRAWWTRTGYMTWASLHRLGFVGHDQECVIYFGFSRKPKEGFKQRNWHGPVYDVSEESDGRKPQEWDTAIQVKCGVSPQWRRSLKRDRSSCWNNHRELLGAICREGDPLWTLESSSWVCNTVLQLMGYVTLDKCLYFSDSCFSLQ